MFSSSVRGRYHSEVKGVCFSYIFAGDETGNSQDSKIHVSTMFVYFDRDMEIYDDCQLQTFAVASAL